MANILIQAELRSFRPKVSGECGLSFNCPAIDKRDLSDFYDLQGMSGWLLFSKHEIQPEDVPDIDPDLETRSKSKRLRNAMFVLWKKKQESGEEDREFDVYYEQTMEGIIDKLKNQISKYDLT